jgi:hypothetical protein
MYKNRLIRTAAVALAIAATAAPVATARPIDGPIGNAGYALPDGFQTADTRDSPAATARGTYQPVPAEPKQDLRSADTRDYADGRGTYNAPEVVVVKSTPPVAEPTSGGGVDWADVGLGAGSLLGLGLIALAGGALIVQRRGAKQLA